MNMDFVIICPLVQHGLPAIRFLSIGSCFCSMLLSDHASGSQEEGKRALPFTGRAEACRLRSDAAERLGGGAGNHVDRQEEQLAHDSNVFTPANLCKTTRRETFGLKFSNSPPTDVE
jgi:hypothetical protein